MLYSLFFLSGAVMFIYEVAWQRMLGTVLGNTTAATAAILTIFFGGIALGSFFFARPQLSAPACGVTQSQVLMRQVLSRIPLRGSQHSLRRQAPN